MQMAGPDNIGLQRTARRPRAAAESGSFGRFSARLSWWALTLIAGILLRPPAMLGQPAPTGRFDVIAGATVVDSRYEVQLGLPLALRAVQVGSGYSFDWTTSEGCHADTPEAAFTFTKPGIAVVDLLVKETTPPYHGDETSETFVVVPNGVLIMGSGNTGTWNTEIRIANPGNQAVELQVGGFPEPVFCTATPCPPPYPVTRVLAPNGELTLLFSDVFAGNGFQFLYVLPTNPTDPVPVVRARAFNIAEPARAMELPVASYAAIASHAGTPLDFPGAAHSATAHSNLAIAEVTQAAGTTIRMDAISTTGEILGTRSFMLTPGQMVVFADVIGSMVGQDFQGHLRVTQISGSGLVNGALATVGTDGSFAVSAGFNP
jgi:hypothetical protein